VLENFKAPLLIERGPPAVSDSPGDRPPESKLYAMPPAPTEVSEIFTPGPIVEEMEIFFT
jgi:hypothetical protein